MSYNDVTLGNLKKMDHSLLSFKGYDLLIEQNETKSRTGIYLRNEIKFNRRTDLEEVNGWLIILDIDLEKKYKLINLYRVFNPIVRIEFSPLV